MDRGGAETLIMNVYRAIDRTVLQFDFLVHEERECDYDSEIIELGGRIFHTFRFNGINAPAYSRFCRRFFAEHHDYCAVHVHIGSCAAFVLREAHRHGLFTIAHSHNTHPPLSVPEIGFRLFSYPTRYLADWYLACSEQAGIDRFGKKVIDGDRFTVLINGIDSVQYRFDPSIRRTVRRKLGIQDTTTLYCHVGRFAPEKNHDFLIKVFAEIATTDLTARLVLVGKGPLEDSVRHEVQAAGLNDRIQFLGIRDDVPRILMAADVFLFPSIYEGFGNVAIEAQATGLPCVLSDALPSIVELSKDCRFLGIQEGKTQWAKTAIELAETHRDSSRIDAYKRVQHKGFDIRETARQLSSIYLEHHALG